MYIILMILKPYNKIRHLSWGITVLFERITTGKETAEYSVLAVPKAFSHAFTSYDLPSPPFPPSPGAPP